MKETAILITGASGGLGKAMVQMSLSLPDIDRIIATDINKNITEAFNDYGERVIPFVMDATSDESIAKVHSELRKRRINVKYIINNAGIFMFHPVSEMTQELLDKSLKVNAFAPILTVSNFLGDLSETKGRVVQISSCAVKFPTMFQSYPASKIAMEALSVSMRQELSLIGVKMIFVRSGAINTGLIKEMQTLAVAAEKSRYYKFYRKFLERTSKDVGKIREPENVAALVLKALTAKKPKNIYTINSNRTIRIFSLFPQKIQDHLIRQMVK